MEKHLDLREHQWSLAVVSLTILITAVGGTDYMAPADPPIVVRNGTNSSVVLDCAYTLSPDDVLIHVKWFHIRGAYTLVFQWINGHLPQALGPLQHRVNLSFTASDIANQRFRALQILRPTLELSGRYLCKVTSTGDGVTMEKRLVVYTSPREMSIWDVRPGYNLVNITCRVRGVYPEPRVEIFRGANTRTMVPIEGLHKYISWQDGLYDVTAFWVTRDEFLEDHTLFVCVMRISDTNYVEKREISYSPVTRRPPGPAHHCDIGTFQCATVFDHQVQGTRHVPSGPCDWAVSAMLCVTGLSRLLRPSPSA